MKGVLKSAARDSQMVLDGCSYKNDKKLRRVGDIYDLRIKFTKPKKNLYIQKRDVCSLNITKLLLPILEITYCYLLFKSS